jgi:hypothetical protein
MVAATICIPQQRADAQISDLPFLHYSAPDYSIQYPAGSQVIEPRQGVVDFLTPQSIFVHIFVTARNNMELNQVTDKLIGLYRQSPSFTLLERNSTNLAGNPGYSIVFASTNDVGRDMVTKSLWTLSDGKAYVLRFSAVLTSYYELPTQAILNKMVDSFQINQGGNQSSGVVLNHTGTR